MEDQSARFDWLAEIEGGRFAIPQDLQWRTRAAGTTGIPIPTSLDGYPRSVFRVDVTRGAPEGQGSI